MILQDQGWQRRNLITVDQDMVEERAADAAEARSHSVLSELQEKRAKTKDLSAEAASRATGAKRKEERL